MCRSEEHLVDVRPLTSDLVFSFFFAVVQRYTHYVFLQRLYLQSWATPAQLCIAKCIKVSNNRLHAFLARTHLSLASQLNHRKFEGRCPILLLWLIVRMELNRNTRQGGVTFACIAKDAPTIAAPRQ